jgi:hypothetical protein
VLGLLLLGCAAGPPGTPHPGERLVLYTAEASAEAEAIARTAQDFLADLGGYLRLDVPPAHLLKIYHYPNRWALWRHLNRQVPDHRWKRGVTYETDLFYVITLSGGPDGKGFQETLRHELAHYLLAVHFCDTPPWIDEGFAQIAACGPPFPHLEEGLRRAVRQEARRGGVRRCRELLLIPPGRTLTASQYRLACALTASLFDRSPESASTALIRFLGESRHDAHPEQAFPASWGLSMDEACLQMAAWAEDEQREGKGRAGN